MKRQIVAARTFRLDVKGAEVREALAAAGVRSVLLKGRAFAHLLYRGDEPRAYTDVDLLLARPQAPLAQDVLRGLGFREFDTEAPSGQTDPSLGRELGAVGALHGGSWIRDADNLIIDVHHSLPQVFTDSDRVWAELENHLEVLDVVGLPTEILDRPASALLVALHAAHHGPQWGSAMHDLEQAITVFDLECWREARAIATRLEAERALGVGLGLSVRGRVIAEELALDTDPGIALRLLWRGAPWAATFLEELAHSGARRRAGLLVRVLCPTPAAMRHGSALARRSGRGLAAAYALRWAQLLWQLPAAAAAWRRLRGSG